MPEMRQRARQVTDRKIICAMLDGMDVMFLGMNDGDAPYVVPLNFGYTFEENLVFYFHCAKDGHKLDCLRRNPNVCVSLANYISYAKESVRGHRHDYRSVIARGTAERIEPESPAFIHAMEQILIHNHRSSNDVHTPVMKHVDMWRVVCRAQDVTAKAEIVPKNVSEVPFLPEKGDGIPMDESHILDMQKN